MDELVKRLRNCATQAAPCNTCDLAEDGFCSDTLMKQAADAIEELQQQAEKYETAYRKEHNKRIAENRYLYDELTKAVREKLLMTPMLIEVPEPTKEE